MVGGAPAATLPALTRHMKKKGEERPQGMRRCCLRAVLHSGLGNWLYVAVQVSLVATAQNCTLVLPDVLHRWFVLPSRVHRPMQRERHCREVRSMQEASSRTAVRQRVVEVTGASSFDAERARTFRELFWRPRVAAAPAPTFRTAVHLRTVSDVACHTYDNIRDCRGGCLREAALACVVANAVPPVLVLSDSAAGGARLVRMFADRGVRDVFDESVVADARNHSVRSLRAAYQSLRLWTAFAEAERRFASGISTFSKSALLARGPRATDFVLDTRCFKAHPSDGALFTCRPASLNRDLVR